MTQAYVPRRRAADRFATLRGLRYHLLEWGEASMRNPSRPTLVMAHGWMDVGASFQFVVDALATDRHVVALDWRGFGLTQAAGADAYWFPDYLGDLDALIDVLAPEGEVDLIGHSMGGNIAMLYAGVRPKRIRKLVNLEGFGMPDARAESAPQRYAQWLDQLKSPPRMREYASLDEVARRLAVNNPRLSADKALWLAAHWAQPGDDGRWRLLADPAHKRVNPILYRREEAVACWRRTQAPVLWIEGADTDMRRWWGDRYPRADFEARLSKVPQVERHVLADCGHMLHHDQPQAVAALVEAFL